MKTLVFRKKNILIKSPEQVDFEDEFDKELYSSIYAELSDGAAFEPVIDVDIFFASGSNFDILELYRQFEKTLPTVGAKSVSGDRLLVKYAVRDSLKKFPLLSGLMKNSIRSVEASIGCAEELAGRKVDVGNFINIKNIIDEVERNAWSRDLDVSEKQSSASIVGGISENLLMMIFDKLISREGFFSVKNKDINSYGDFVLMCLPNNLWISVKSNFARERLLASGYSNDILGVGFFQDAKEFTGEVRIRNLQRAGFLAMYCPDVPVSKNQVEMSMNTYCEVIEYFKKNGIAPPTNINGKPFIRKLSALADDLEALLSESDIQKRTTVRF